MGSTLPGRKRATRGVRWAFVLVSAALALLLLASLCSPRVRGGLHLCWRRMAGALNTRRPFDSRIWRAARSHCTQPNPRGDMVHDLMRRHLRQGMTRAEVMVLLGEPDGPADQSAVSYSVGPRLDGWLGIDPYVLDIRFAADGKVTGWLLWEG